MNISASDDSPELASFAPASRFRPFSPARIVAITLNTLTELTRQKVFYVLVIFGILLIGSSVFLARFTFQQEFQILKDVSLGAISIFSSLLAIVATARLIPQDVDDRTVYTILAKPVPRFEYLLGKLTGVLALARDQHRAHDGDVHFGPILSRTKCVTRNGPPIRECAARAT